MKLYYSKGACSLAVRIIINELNLPCEYEAVDLRAKKTATDADFLKINSKGAVPTLLLDNNEVLTENAVIQQYLADTHQAHQLLPPVGDLKRYRVLEWLNYVTTELHKGVGALFNPKVTETIKEEIFLPNIKYKLNYVDQHLAQNKFLLGDHFSLPDAYIFVILGWLNYFKIDIAQWPNVARYFKELKNRPSIEKSLQEEGLN